MDENCMSIVYTIVSIQISECLTYKLGRHV